MRLVGFDEVCGDGLPVDIASSALMVFECFDHRFYGWKTGFWWLQLNY